LSWTFFVDRDLGRHIFPDALQAAGLTVERHHDHFAPTAEDKDWLPVVAENGWVVLTGDQHILRRPLEVAAIRQSKALVLVLVGNHSPATELAANFVNTLPKIHEALGAMKAPAVAKVYRPSPTTLVLSGKPGSIEIKALR
jgi:hypothetical protein